MIAIVLIVIDDWWDCRNSVCTTITNIFNATQCDCCLMEYVTKERLPWRDCDVHIEKNTIIFGSDFKGVKTIKNTYITYISVTRLTHKKNFSNRFNIPRYSNQTIFWTFMNGNKMIEYLESSPSTGSSIMQWSIKYDPAAMTKKNFQNLKKTMSAWLGKRIM